MSARLTNSEQSIIDLLSTASEGLTVSELAERLSLKPTSVKVLVCRIRQKGYEINSPRQESPTGCLKGVRQAYTLGGIQ